MSSPPLQSFRVRVNTFDDRLLLISGMEAFELNDVAGEIWSMCDGTNERQDIVAAVAGKYEISESEAERDVAAFLDQLERAGLLER